MDAASKRSITQFGCSKLYCLLPLLLSLLILTPSLSFAATNPDDGKQALSSEWDLCMFLDDFLRIFNQHCLWFWISCCNQRFIRCAWGAFASWLDCFWWRSVWWSLARRYLQCLRCYNKHVRSSFIVYITIAQIITVSKLTVYIIFDLLNGL